MPFVRPYTPDGLLGKPLVLLPILLHRLVRRLLLYLP